MPSCPSCGSPVPGHKRFCADCGAALDVTSAPTETTHRSRPPAPAGPGRDLAEGARFIPGTKLAGRYRIVSLLGRGGMGEVYRADDLKLGQTVALKFLPPSLRRDPERRRCLLNEVRMARQVSHPNVCRVYDAGEVDGQHFLSMEYVDGEDLASLLRRIGRLPKDKAVELARQLCAGLAAAHEQGILHRDLKPANVMIDGRGRARITDFGLAALAPEIGGVEVSAGTPAYMAPEQFAGRAVTIQSDLYALGLVLYELFTGRSAFPETTPAEIARRPSESTPTSPSDHVEGFDPVVERVILRCLEVDPANRPRSALAVSAALPGGDPLAAALAAGETPSPEMVAAAGVAEAMHPVRALALALLGVGLFVATATIEGHFEARAYLPMGKPPPVLIDGARGIIAGLGYTEPAYAEPADTAIGFTLNRESLTAIRKKDPSPDRWERLRDPRAGVLSFWYRQGPRTFEPHPEAGSAGGVQVGPWNPFPQTTGEILVALEPDGRLATFVAVPRRYRESAAAETEYDWSVPFRLAGLDLADFERTEPRYQHFMHLDQRAAWIPRDPDARYRIEAGVNEGRLSLFRKLDEEEAARLAAEPEKFSASTPNVVSGTFLTALIVGAILALVNVRRGRVDRRSAIRLAVVMTGLGLFSSLLKSHPLRLDNALGGALFTGLFALVTYMALEPHARAIWPSMLVSWTRLIGRSGRGWRDPLVGRAALAGVVAGGAASLMLPASNLLVLAWEGAPATPTWGSWTGLIGQRYAWGEIVTRIEWGLTEGLVMAFLMVLGRLVFRRPLPAAVAAGALWLAPDVIGILAFRQTWSPVEIASHLLVLVVIVAVLIAVLLRWGLVGVIAMSVTGMLGLMAGTTDWTAWHAQPSILCVFVVAALAACAYGAATPGRHLFGDGAPARSAPTIATR